MKTRFLASLKSFTRKALGTPSTACIEQPSNDNTLRRSRAARYHARKDGWSRKGAKDLGAAGVSGRTYGPGKIQSWGDER